ncbi:MAG: CheR family methyltransferase [Bacteriovoracaceae bacterium]|nr:CheR family methyltransferase [Bacteriovoracaceae bacterium]
MLNFTKDEIEFIFTLAEKLTGSSQEGACRKDVLISNVQRRMQKLNISNLQQYFAYVVTDNNEYCELLSSLTIHTTSWFRESPHFEFIYNYLLEQERSTKKDKSFNGHDIKIWSSACSTGEEVYSVALFLEQKIKQNLKNWKIKYFGSDIDPASVRMAVKGIYPRTDMDLFEKIYHPFLRVGSGKTQNYFTLESEIRGKCQFYSQDLMALRDNDESGPFDIVFCRNVLIYFKSTDAQAIIESLAHRLKPGGLLVLGHSENVLGLSSQHRFDNLGKGCFQKKINVESITLNRKILKNTITNNVSKLKCLVIDDSLVIRKKMQSLLSSMNFNVRECESAEEASEIIEQDQFQLITLDINLPGMNGIEWLKQQRAKNLKIPVVLVSDSTPEEANKIFGGGASGAHDYLVKSKLHTHSEEIKELFFSLAQNYELKRKEESKLTLATSKASVCEKKINDENSFVMVKSAPFGLKDFSPELIVIGSSTGGPDCLAKLLVNMPFNCPPIIVVQHITTEFLSAFATHLAKQSSLKLGGTNLKEDLTKNEELKRGHIYFSLGDYHILVKEIKGKLILETSTELNRSKLNGHRPSIDILFSSVAKNVSKRTLALLMTGMGEDGANGMLELFKTSRSLTMAQNEMSSIVYGMPKRAVELGAVCLQGGINELRNKMLTFVAPKIQKEAS